MGMNDNDLITRREVELVLLEKGQKSKRYKLGEIWELNFDEIREALSEYQSEIVRCKDCKWYDERISMCDNCGLPREQTFFCADGKGVTNRMDREKIATEFVHLLNAAKGNYQDFVDLTVDFGEEILAVLKEQEAEIRQLRLALDIAKGTCKGIKSGGGQFADMSTMQSAT